MCSTTDEGRQGARGRSASGGGQPGDVVDGVEDPAAGVDGQMGRLAGYPSHEHSFDVQSDTSWLLLIYTVPAEPTRKRAFIWREVKKIGCIYLHDGVCILPERPHTLEAARRIAAKVDEFGGQATVVTGAQLDAVRSQTVVAQFRAARAQEYLEIVREADQLLAHVARETDHREFTYAELEELEADLGKLKRWSEQIRARDYFPDIADAEARDRLERCEHALAAFLEEAVDQDARGQ